MLAFFDKEISMHVVSHQTLDALQQVARKEKNARRRIRLQVIILALQGHTAPQIAQALSVSRRSLQEWVQRYNQHGLEGLRDRRGGNHRHLTADQEKALCAYLDRTAADPRDGVRRGEDLRQWIHQHFHVLYSLNGIYDLLHRLGYSCLMPRPRHAQADPQAQEAFKKKRWTRSGRLPSVIPASASRSGSRTRPVSANRAPSHASGPRPAHGPRQSSRPSTTGST